MNNFDEKLNSLLSNPDAMGQIFQLAQSLGRTSEPVIPSTPSTSAQRDSAQKDSPAGGIDLNTLIRFLPLIQQLGEQNENTRAFLLAMRPYLKPERQEKIEQALQLSHLICVGKTFLKNREE